MPVHGHLGGFGRRRNRIHRYTVDALIEKQRLGSLEHPVARGQPRDWFFTHARLQLTTILISINLYS